MSMKSVSFALCLFLTIGKTLSIRFRSEPRPDGKTISHQPSSADHDCPYATNGRDTWKIPGVIPYQCHALTDEYLGLSCPELQLARSHSAWRFGTQHAHTYIDAADSFEIHELFDKKGMVVGGENYEMLDRYHIQCLMRDSPEAMGRMYSLEDKGELKVFAEKAFADLSKGSEYGYGDDDKENGSEKSAAAAVSIAELPYTHVYYTAYCPNAQLSVTGHACQTPSSRSNHASYQRMEFVEVLRGFCDGKTVDNFIIKPTHLSWSAGIKAVKGWQEKCARAMTIEEDILALARFAEENILTKANRASDAHLALLEPGLTVEELFQTGGHSKRPLEAKVELLFGKVYTVFFVGDDHRGCTVGAGAWNVYADRTGWNLAGIIGVAEDDVHDEYMKRFHDRVVNIAETFAAKAGADWTRVDLFLSGFGGGKVVIKLNEVENVSGYKFPHETAHIGNAWRDGYMQRHGVRSVTPESWQRYVSNLLRMRDAFDLDADSTVVSRADWDRLFKKLKTMRGFETAEAGK